MAMLSDTWLAERSLLSRVASAFDLNNRDAEKLLNFGWAVFLICENAETATNGFDGREKSRHREALEHACRAVGGL